MIIKRLRLIPIVVIVLLAAPVLQAQAPFRRDSVSAPASPALSRDTTIDTTSLNHPPQKLKLTIRAFEDRKQIILGACMMIFIALMMTTAQQFNPG